MPTADCKLVSQIVDLPAGTASAVSECGTRTALTAYLLEGTLHVSIAGAQELLEQGDCIVVDTDQAFIWQATKNSRCRILSVSAK